jgi:hypothetical protein
MATLQRTVPVQRPSIRRKSNRLPAWPVSVTAELPAKAPMQRLPQSMPAGLEVMVPLPARSSPP